MNLITKIIALAFLIMPTTFALSQTNNFKFTNQVKISPLKTIDVINPGIELSYEKLYKEKYSSQISIAWMKNVFKVSNFKDYKGLRVAVEQKFFFPEEKTQQYYVSGELVFLKVNYGDVSSFSKDSATSYKDSFTVAKKTFCGNFKVGVQIPMKRFILDMSIGAGIKYKMTKRNGIIDRDARELTPIDPNAYASANVEGNYFTLSLPVNIRIGYRF